MAEGLLPAPESETSSACVSSPFGRRLQGEWRLLLQLQAANPNRIADVFAEDCTFHVTLLQTPALALKEGTPIPTKHQLRIIFPRFFPAVPMEAFLLEVVRHPNIHPESGFICLWDTHRVSNTVEHALLKVEAMLGWRLLNLEPRHQMQADCDVSDADAVARSLGAVPLVSITHVSGVLPDVEPRLRRRCLS